MPPRRRRTSRSTRRGELAVLPVRDAVLFPNQVSPLIIHREISLRAVEHALKTDSALVVVAQRDADIEDVGPEDLYTVGSIALVGRTLKMPDGSTNALIQGQQRVRLTNIRLADGLLMATVEPLEEITSEGESVDALRRAVITLFEKSVKLSRSIPEDTLIAAMNIDEPGYLADLIAWNIELGVAERQEILETLDTHERLKRISVLLAKELDVLELQTKIHTQVQQEVDKSQREYFLREQLKAIQKELGESDLQTREINELREKIAAANMPEAVRAKAEEELQRLAMMPAVAPEVSVIRTYLDWLIKLPWSNATEDLLDIKQASVVLDRNHYGLSKVKQRILEYLAVRKLAGGRLRSPILCLVGPPGVGKTSLGRSIAEAMGRRFVRVSLGGIRDEAEIRGHRRTYIGALPGRIIQTMVTAGTVNPLFMLDEVDKLGMDFRGDPASALLEVLDPEQNSAFSDHYLDVPYDLSRVMFITTANILDPIPAPLQDRMEVIELPGYIEEEKLEIAKRFLVPRQIEEHGLQPDQLRFSDSALLRVIREYTHEAGVRNLEREIGSVCRKIARLVAEGEKAPKLITASAIPHYLGPQKYFWGTAEEKDEVGAATGVVWTEMGGDTITIEVTLMEGKGNLLLTGQLGDVMKESGQAALSYARSRASLLNIPSGTFEKTDIHVHVPAGAIPKDGPSAGITIATAIISALTRRPVRRDVAMTGEITLRGRVLPVGGLKEKIIAAHRAGITTFILPEKNVKDLEDVPAHVKRGLRFVHVKHMDEVLETALLNRVEAGETSLAAVG